MSIEQKSKELLREHSADFADANTNIHFCGALTAIEAALRLRDFTELQEFDKQLSAAYRAGSDGIAFDILAAKESVRAALQSVWPGQKGEAK